MNRRYRATYYHRYLILSRGGARLIARKSSWLVIRHRATASLWNGSHAVIMHMSLGFPRVSQFTDIFDTRGPSPMADP